MDAMGEGVQRLTAAPAQGASAAAAPSLFDLADRRLAWLDKRQGVLAQNIANADTPGYVARDLAPFARTLAGQFDALAPARTSPLHLSGLSQGIALAAAEPQERSIDGNAVSLDGELTKVADTDTTQEFVSTLYHKYLGLYRTALGR